MKILLLSLVLLSLDMSFAIVQAAPATNIIVSGTVTTPAMRPRPQPLPIGSGNATSEDTMITPLEWHELREAHREALNSNPDLLKNAAVLAAKMHAFQQKLDAAIVKAYPDLASTVAKIENPAPPSHMTPAASAPAATGGNQGLSKTLPAKANP